MGIIEFKDVNKSYDTLEVIKDLSLEIKRGELITILGTSGCGKTTLLKMVNKLIEPTSGQIYVHGREVKDWDSIQLRRCIGYVIQHIGLMPHLTIRNNITYVLGLMGAKEEEMEARARELIQLMGMSEELLGRYPRQLSGGQRQRVGVARALAADPDIVLMDEPFGAVDEINRSQLQDELKDLQGKLQKTILLVTHDIPEALKLGTRIILLRDGQIEQIGTKEELVMSPKTEYVKQFLGTKGLQSIIEEEVMRDLYHQMLQGEDISIATKEMKFS